MRKSSFVMVAAAAVMVLGVAAGTASATSGAHFFSAVGSVNSSGALVVSWDEAGVGQQEVDYKITADASATYDCINGGGNHPKAANKVTFQGPLASPVLPFTPNNGRVTGSDTLGPLSSGSFACPSGQSLVLACVSYSKITLKDITNNVTAAIPDIQATSVNPPGC